MRLLHRALVSIAASSILAITALPASAATILQNGGFETGDFSSWTTPATLPGFYLVAAADSTNGMAPTMNGYYVFDGKDAAQLGTLAQSTLSQTFTATPGQYLLTFWLNGDFASAASASFFNTSVDGAALNLSNPVFGWTPETLPFTVTNSSANVLNFAFQDANGNFLSLDDVSITPAALTSSTPEPATVFLFGTGICGLTLVARRRSFNI